MDTHAVEHFYAILRDALRDRWGQDGLRPLSREVIPDDLFGQTAWLLQADHRTTIARWFVEGLVDLAKYERSDLKLGHLYLEVKASVRTLAGGRPSDEVDAVSRRLAAFAWQEVNLRRNARRHSIRQTIKNEVWLGSPSPQRCYLCGYQFRQDARDIFLRRTTAELQPRNLVDFIRPRGLKPRHLAIELDHIIPVAEGGETTAENLALACGWCNSVKSRFCSIYDANAWSRGIFEHRALGAISLPQPLWLVRIVATRARCEHPEGCQASLSNHELFVAPRNPRGALNPTNLIVVCQNHDPWRHHRLVAPAELARG